MSGRARTTVAYLTYAGQCLFWAAAGVALVFGLLLLLTSFTTDREGETLSGCPRDDGIADLRAVRDDLDRWLTANGVEPLGRTERGRYDARGGPPSEFMTTAYRRDGVDVRLKFFPADPCRDHGAHQRLDWEVQGPGYRTAPYIGAIEDWVPASLEGRDPAPLGPATDPRPGRLRHWLLLAAIGVAACALALPKRTGGEARRAPPQAFALIGALLGMGSVAVFNGHSPLHPVTLLLALTGCGAVLRMSDLRRSNGGRASS